MKNIVELLKEQKKTLATAESLTGGLVADAVVSIAGASEVFLGGIVSSRVKKRAGALTGLISGILFVALLFLLSVLLGEDSFSIGKSVVLYTALLLLSVLGGTLGAHKRGRRRRKKRRK